MSSAFASCVNKSVLMHNKAQTDKHNKPCQLHAVEGGASFGCRQLLYPEALRAMQLDLSRDGSHCP